MAPSDDCPASAIVTITLLRHGRTAYDVVDRDVVVELDLHEWMPDDHQRWTDVAQVDEAISAMRRRARPAIDRHTDGAVELVRS